MGSSSAPDYCWIGCDGDFRWDLDDLAPPPAGRGVDVEGGVYGNGCCPDRTGSEKRARSESCGGAKSKAYREKIRRDRLNDRFLELCTVLDPGRPPKSDKASILNDAARALLQLKSEAQELKEANEKLQETIKVLKAEKNELRDEKTKLKGEKERLEQQVKMISVSPSGFIQPHPAMAFHAAAAAAFAAQTQASRNRTAAYPAYPGVPAWQWLPHGPWLPPASRDTTEDPKHISPSA